MFDGNQVTEAMLRDAAGLFYEHYGIWGVHPTTSSPTPREGKSHKTLFVGRC